MSDVTWASELVDEMIRRLRVLTWNVNGLRAVLQRLGMRSLREFLDSLEADIVCLQETKMTRAELDEDFVRPPGYDAFYSFCRTRGGYSGVATFCKADIPTFAAEEGLTGYWPTADPVGHAGSKHTELPPRVLTDLESEGRCLVTDHGAFVLLNLYCPALASTDRLEFKMNFHALLQDRVDALRAANKHVIVLGDINIAHRKIDHCDPGTVGDVAFEDQPHRQWMNSFVCTLEEDKASVVSAEGESSVTRPCSGHARLVDVFRHFHPNQTKAFTCWSTVTGARQTNYGTRIDYVLVDALFLDEFVTGSSIEAGRLGSDHCPVVMDAVVQFPLDPEAPRPTAALCAKYFTEFTGTQQSIRSFLVQPGGSGSQEALPSTSSAKAAVMATDSSRAAPRSRPRSAVSTQRSIASFFSVSAARPSNKTSATPAGKAAPPASNGIGFEDVDGALEVMAAIGSKRKADANAWQQVLSGRPPPTPLCHCGQPTVLRFVLKAGENRGRKFFVCTKPAGEKGNPEARCEFFQWADKKPPAKRSRS